jgi:hypothetical protein
MTPEISLKLTKFFDGTQPIIEFESFTNGYSINNPVGRTALIGKQFIMKQNGYVNNNWGYVYNLMFSVIETRYGDYLIRIESVL